MTETIEEFKTLFDVISFLPESKRTNVVAISGFLGSGKTTLAHKLAQSLPECGIVSADDFMLNNFHERSADWACIDRQRIIDEVLKPAEKGQEIKFHVYNWDSGSSNLTETLGMPKVLLLEGIGIIHPDLQPYFNFSIWVDEDLKTAAKRGMQRDKEVLHIDNDLLWTQVWMLNDQEYHDKYYPHQLVDYLYKESLETETSVPPGQNEVSTGTNTDQALK